MEHLKMDYSIEKYNALYNSFVELLNQEKEGEEAKNIMEDTISGIEEGDYKKLKQQIIWQVGENKLSFSDEDVEQLSKIKFKDIEKEQKQIQNVDVKSFLIEERTKFQSLGCGFHNGIYYFGTKLFREGNSFSAIITSDRNIYINKQIRVRKELFGENEIVSKFGLKYKDDFYDEALDHLFSNKAVERFLYDDISNITLESVYEKIVSVLKEYMYFDEDVKYKLVACYRIAGFFMSVWKARARLFINAEAGSSKSRLADILHNTGFNSVNLGDWTLAFLQRMIESTRGETHIDDFETLDEEKQKATTRLVKTGYTKGKKAGKTGDNSRKPEVYDLFNTTTINAIVLLDFISTDRCITIRIPKVSNSKYDQEPDFNKPIFQEIRDELYILGLKEAKNVEEEYPKTKSDKLSGRLFSIIKPELTIAKLISNDLFNEIESFWEEEIEQREHKDLTEDWEFQSYKKIYNIVVEKDNEDFFILYDDVVIPIIKEMYDEYPETIKKYKYKISHIIGNHLARNPIFRHRLVNGKTQYKVKKNQLINLLKAKRYLKHITNSTNTINSINSIISTNSTTEKEEKVVEKVEDIELVESEPGLVQKENTKNIIRLIEENDVDNEGVSFAMFQEFSDLDDNKLIEEINRLVTKGDIYSNKPDRYKVLK